MDPGEDRIVAAFDSRIENSKTCFVKCSQFFRCLAVDVSRSRIGADAGQAGEQVIAFFYDVQQVFGFQDQGVAVSDKDTAHIGVSGGTAFNDTVDFFQGTDPEPRFLIHRAECARIVGTADGGTQYETIGFAGGTKYHAFSVINIHIYHPFMGEWYYYTILYIL